MAAKDRDDTESPIVAINNIHGFVETQERKHNAARGPGGKRSTAYQGRLIPPSPPTSPALAIPQ